MTQVRDVSVVVPVFNEAETLRALLEVLASNAGDVNVLVVVVCNGCTDGSVAVARSFPGVEVVDLAEASKARALNVGDERAGDVFPRLYVDADVVFARDALARLVDALCGEDEVGVGPESDFLTEGKPWIVRGYYFGLTRLPRRTEWRSRHLTGRGVYGTNRAGRALFAEFPPLRADDAFFDAQFRPGQRRIVRDAIVGVHVPESARALVRNIARVRAANRELAAWLAAAGGETTSEDEVGAGGIAVRTRRTVRRWKQSRVVVEFEGVNTISLLAGYAAAQVLAWSYQAWLRAARAEVHWR